MNSQRRIGLVLALAFVVAAVAAPAAAGVKQDGTTLQLQRPPVETPVGPKKGNDGPGDVLELNGDPENWLGGQNVRPKPPSNGNSNTLSGWIESLLLLWADMLDALSYLKL